MISVFEADGSEHAKAVVSALFTAQPREAGERVELIGTVTEVGRTSLRVRIEMYREDPLSGDRSICTTGELVMVAVNEEGRPTAIDDEGAA